MGIHAAHCMTNKAADTGTSFAFELFTHATHFMGQKVILLGLYNGQGLDKEPESDMITYSRALEVWSSPSLLSGKHCNRMWSLYIYISVQLAVLCHVCWDITICCN